MKRLFTEEQVDFSGTYYSVAKGECRPKTIQKPHPPLMIAGGGDEILALAGREADIVAIVPPGRETIGDPRETIAKYFRLDSQR